MKITLIMASKDPAKVSQYIGQALSISPLFDRVIVHSNSYPSTIYVPQYRNMTILFDDKPISCPDALNHCLAQEEVDWILPICDDDFCDIHELEQLIHKIRDGWYEDKDIIYSQYWIGNDKKGWVPTENPTEVSLERLKIQNYIPFTSFYKRKVWEDIKGYKNMPFNDWLFWLEAAKLNKKFEYYDKSYFYFRQGHTVSLADTEYKKQPFDLTRKQLLDFIEKNER